MTRPERTVLLDVTTAGNRVVAVGERGVVVISDDAGLTWRQAKVPTSVSLTAVTFPTPKMGWAVGHSGVVLHTKDGGEIWKRQLDGVAAARLTFEAAKNYAARVGADDATANQQIARSFLSMTVRINRFSHFISKTRKRGLSSAPMALHTTRWTVERRGPPGLPGPTIRVRFIFMRYRWLAIRSTWRGEQGLFCRSTDGGKHFQRIETPYRGSYFTSAVTATGELVIAGLRGNAYWTSDQGQSFQPINVPVPVSFSASHTGVDGTVIFANQAGHLLIKRGTEKELVALGVPRMPPVTSLTQLSDGTIVVVGGAGAIRLPLLPGGKKERNGGAS